MIYRIRTILAVMVILAFSTAKGQLGVTYDIDKPEKFENRKLGYEKTYEKKYSLPRKFIQNTISHYNFFFNANEKIKEVIARASATQKDSFDRLLNYYGYSLDQTAQQKTELDSVIIKTSGGILLHDLRTNWVDNFYLLMAKAYLLGKLYDSAAMTLHYINYEFAPKDKDGDRVLVGSTANEGENTIFSISTKEKRNLKTKLFERPPSRNESFIWMIRTYIEQEDFGSAAGLINTLRNDPVFPKRLYAELDEVNGYLFYRQGIYDSAAHYLVNSIELAEGKAEKSRREYLAAQLYELGNKPALATELYSKAVKHTLDPVMEVYARLNAIKLRKSEDPKVIQDNIDALLKMAKKDAYQDYRDIIYFFAAKMELERNHLDDAKKYFIKSTQYASNNLSQKNQAFLALADMAYKKRDYPEAAAYYDSLNTADPALPNPEELISRREVLTKLVARIETIATEDSLLRVAGMNENDRNDYLDKLLRRLRKEQGLKEDPMSGGGNQPNPQFGKVPDVNLFENNKGEWYFYNPTLKARGFSDFRNKWGTRPNVDGWRRMSAITQYSQGANVRGGNNNTQDKAGNNKKKVAELTLEALKANLPLNDSMVTASNDTIMDNLLQLGKLYQYNLEDYPLAIETYESIIKRYPATQKLEEVLFHLYHCYQKTGDTQKAAYMKQLLEKSFANGTYANILNKKPGAEANQKVAATKDYEDIYNLFLEGKFEDAIQKKKLADTKYGNSYWTPQLLYIEAIYHIKQRSDSSAIASLTTLVGMYSDSPLRMKAENLLNVLNRRKQIEDELAKLQVTRLPDDPIIVIDSNGVAKPVTPPVVTPVQPTVKPDTVAKPPVKPVVKDTVAVPKPAVPKYIYKNNAEASHYAVVLLSRVDNIFVNEARNSFIIFNRSYGRVLEVTTVPLNEEYKMLVIGPIGNAATSMAYTDAAQQKAASEIVPWLGKEKYSFIIITPENLQLLQGNKDVSGYKSFLGELYPGKF